MPVFIGGLFCLGSAGFIFMHRLASKLSIIDCGLSYCYGFWELLFALILSMLSFTLASGVLAINRLTMSLFLVLITYILMVLLDSVLFEGTYLIPTFAQSSNNPPSGLIQYLTQFYQRDLALGSSCLASTWDVSLTLSDLNAGQSTSFHSQMSTRSEEGVWLLQFGHSLDVTRTFQEWDLPGIILLVYYGLLLAYLMSAIIRALVLVGQQRWLAKDTVTRGVMGFGLLDFLGVPRTSGASLPQRWSIVAFFMLAAIGVTAFWYLTSTLFLPAFLADDRNLMVYGAKLLDGESPRWLVVLYYIPVAGLLPLSRASLRIAQNIATTSIEQVQAVDMRPPIFFLRAFHDDQVTFGRSKVSPSAWLWDVLQPPSNLDQVLLREGIAFGPIVALGNPEDDVPPYGAARGYFEVDDWHRGVAALAADAAAIVISVDNTDGVWWEVNHIKESGHMDKTLFLVHPRHAECTANLELVRQLLAQLKIEDDDFQSEAELQRAAAEGSPIIGLYFGGEKVELLTSSTFSRLAFNIAARRFLREKLGGAPRPVIRPVTGVNATPESATQLVASGMYGTVAPYVLAAAERHRSWFWPAAAMIVLGLFAAEALENQQRDNTVHSLLTTSGIVSSKWRLPNDIGTADSASRDLFEAAESLLECGDVMGAMLAYRRFGQGAAQNLKWSPENLDLIRTLYLANFGIAAAWAKQEKFALAIASFDNARAVLNRAIQLDPTNSLHLQRLRTLIKKIAEMTIRADTSESANATLRTKVTALLNAHSATPEPPDVLTELVSIHQALASAFEKRKQWDNALAEMSEVLKYAQLLHDLWPKDITANGWIANAYGLIADYHSEAGRVDKQLEAYAEQLKRFLLLRSVGADSAVVARSEVRTLGNVAVTLRQQGQLNEALAAFRRASEIVDAGLEADPENEQLIEFRDMLNNDIERTKNAIRGEATK